MVTIDCTQKIPRVPTTICTAHQMHYGSWNVSLTFARGDKSARGQRSTLSQVVKSARDVRVSGSAHVADTCSGAYERVTTTGSKQLKFDADLQTRIHCIITQAKFHDTHN